MTANCRKKRHVGVRELKNKLSSYLKEVKEGAILIVTEHEKVIAELRPPSHSENPVLTSWIERGLVAPPTRAAQKLEVSRVKLPDGTGLRLLNEDRDG